MQAKMELRQNKVIPITLFDDCLKDARLPKEKIGIPGKTRIFSTSPVDFTIHVKQMFMDFQAAYKHNRISLNHAIGINPDGAEWAMLARALRSKGENFVTGDYKNFGPSLCSKVVACVLQSIVQWYEQYNTIQPVPWNHRNIRWCLIQEMMYAYHITYDVVWQAVCGMPSGCPLTVEINSGVNELYILMAWRHINKDNVYDRSFHVFYESTKLMTYGDDLIMAVSDKFKDTFNNLTISNFFKEHNIVFTDASKKGNTPYESRLEDCSFLKRSFKEHPLFPNELLAPLDEDVSVKDVVNWVVKHPDMLAATEQAIIACNLNAYTLGPDKCKSIQDVLKQGIIKLKSKLILRSWDDMDHIHYSQYYLATK